ncbi:MAG: c-type cytochrome [Pseudomonadota bacterium]
MPALNALPAIRIIAAFAMVTAWPATSIAEDNDFTKSTYSSQGDAARGEKVFKRCKSCHHVTNQVPSRAPGPHLFKVFGRVSAGDQNYKYYSDALKAANLIWTEERLFAFLEDPNRYRPGIKPTMRIQKVRDAQSRMDLLAYMRQATEPR